MFTNLDGTANHREMLCVELLENTEVSKTGFCAMAVKQAKRNHMEEGSHEALENMRTKCRIRNGGRGHTTRVT